MMYEEFNKLSGKVCDRTMYEQEVEPIYMEFDELTKEQIAKLYWEDGKDHQYFKLYQRMKNYLNKKIRTLNTLKSNLENFDEDIYLEIKKIIYDKLDREKEDIVKELNQTEF